MSSLWDTRLPRIDYEAIVELEASPRGKRFAATTINLSEGGMCVGRALPEGSEVICHLPVGSSIQALRAQTAWTNPATGRSGLVFTERKRQADSSLRMLISESSSARNPVRLYLPDRDEPFYGSAHLTRNGIFARANLPYVQRGIEIRFHFVRDPHRIYRGLLCDFHGTAAGLLDLDIEIAEPAEAMEPTTPVRVRARGTNPQSGSAVPARDSSLQPLSAEPTLVVRPLPFKAQRRHRRAFLVAMCAAAVACGVAVAILTRSAPRGTSEQGAVAAGAHGSRARTEDRSAEDRNTEDRSAEDRRTEDRSAEDRRTEDRSAEDRRTEDRSAEDRRTDDRSAEDRSTDDRSTEDRNTAIESPSRLVPRLERSGGRTIVRIPFEGSAEDLDDYEVGEPWGVNVNLPNAYAQPVAKHWFRRDGVKVVWIRQRLQHLQVRVLFFARRTYRISTKDSELLIEVGAKLPEP